MLLNKLDNVVELVSRGSVINEAYPVKFFMWVDLLKSEV